jgi:hypothetical protein
LVNIAAYGLAQIVTRAKRRTSRGQDHGTDFAVAADVIQARDQLVHQS